MTGDRRRILARVILPAFVAASVLGTAGCRGGRGGGETASELRRGTDVPDRELTAADVPDGGDAVSTADLVRGEPVVLLEKGKGSHQIVLSPLASQSEKWGAEELQSFFAACTGVELPIVQAVPADGSPMIVLGRSEAAEALGVAPDPEELGEQGYLIRTVPPHLVIAGTPEAGTMYGVQRFLEEFLGVRWYAPGVTLTPPTDSLLVPPTDRLVRPAFPWRCTSYKWPGKDDAFRARMADNSGDGGGDHPFGIQHSHDGRAHSYFWYVHPDEFFDEHPEYFSEIGGVRVRDKTQLCLTNPEVLDLVTERMLQRMADKPDDRQHNFSQMDHYNYCQCDQCREMNQEYGTHGGTQFWFVNELAFRTSLEYPDKLIGTLAYMYTEEPPQGLEMHPNVAVWLCHMFPSCDSHPIESCPDNADYKRRAEEWSALVSHLYVWHYVVDFMHYYNPFPNFRAMAADMRFYRAIGAEGIYLQGMSKSGGGGEFSLMRPYYGMKLLWDPDLDPESLRQDFLQGVYGPAWEPIRDYVEMLLDEVTDNDIHMHLYTNPAQGYLPDSVLDQARVFFDAAEAAVAADKELLERVRVARMPLTYARIFPRNGYQIEKGKLNWGGELASPAEVKEFVDRMEAHGFKSIREVGGELEYLLLMYSVFSSDLKVWEVDNGHLRVEVVAELGGRALRITHLDSGHWVTAHDVRPNLYFPYAGGLEDRVGEGFEFYGWVEPATVTAHDETSLTVALNTVNGWALSRTLALADDAPVVHVKTTLTNPDSAAREVRLRRHLELDLGELHETRVAFTALDGTEVDTDISGIIANQREGEHYYDQRAPANSWSFTGSKGLTVTQSFDSEQVDFGWLYAYPDSLEELEVELWAERREVGPGESLVFETTLEVGPAD